MAESTTDYEIPADGSVPDAEPLLPEDDEDFEIPIPKVSHTTTFAILAIVFTAALVFILYSVQERKRKEAEQFTFFDQLEENQFKIKLPPPVDEYYDQKEACLKKGWQPGQGKPSQEQNAGTPGRDLGQALMKRAIADIPLIQHMQKEAQGMYRLHGKNMCSEVQWRNFQAAEALVSAEVEEVRAEADEVEPGWSQAIWRQAAQYHQMLKQRHDQEQAAKNGGPPVSGAPGAPAAVQQAPAPVKELTMEQKKAAAEKAAKSLLAEESRSQGSKKSVGGDGAVKKGFLDGGGGSGKKGKK